MKKTGYIFLLFFSLAIWACSGNKPDTGSTNDSVSSLMPDTTKMSDSVRLRFRNLVKALPVPYEIIKKFSGSGLAFRQDLLSNPANSAMFADGKMQAFNLGVYGVDMAYMISQDKLADAAPYLKSIRKLSDAVVVPTAFDAGLVGRYEQNKTNKDSMHILINASYKRIDSTLQDNERFELATLVIYGGWIESIYITTQHIGEDKQNDKNKVLFDILSIQQPSTDNIIELLSSFPKDSTCAMLLRETKIVKESFPNSTMSPEEFAAKLKQLRETTAAIRNKLISIN
jgi:hypothetical protein